MERENESLGERVAREWFDSSLSTVANWYGEPGKLRPSADLLGEKARLAALVDRLAGAPTPGVREAFDAIKLSLDFAWHRGCEALGVESKCDCDCIEARAQARKALDLLSRLGPPEEALPEWTRRCAAEFFERDMDHNSIGALAKHIARHAKEGRAK